MRFRKRNYLAGRYQLLEELGAGSMGTVYRAIDRRSSRVVAIKVLHPNLRSEPGYLERFRREAQVSLALDSRHIVQTLASGQDDDTHFLVMEHVDGTTLSSVLRQQGRLSEKDACRIAVQVARALEEAASKGIIHRDIKPDNVIVQANGNVKIADFGIAKAESLGSLGTVDVMGSVQYMAPEQLDPGSFGGVVDTRADIYSTGVVLYEMLAGRPPFAVASGSAIIRGQSDEATPDITEAVPDGDVSPDLARIIRRCTAKSPSDRFETAAALRREVEMINPDLQRVEGLDLRLARAASMRGGRRFLAAAPLVVLSAVVGGWLVLSALDAKPVQSPATPAPWFEFASDFEDGFAAFDQGRVYVRETGIIGRLDQRGAKIEVIPDPTGSNRGMVMKASIEGPPRDPVTEEDLIQTNRRGYPYIVFPFKPLPCSIQEDFWVSRELAEQAQGPGNWFEQLNFRDATSFEDDKWHTAVGTGFRRGSLIALNIPDLGYYPEPLPGAPTFVAETWVTLKIVVEADGKVSLYQDGILIGAGQLPPTTRRGLVAGYGGLNVGHVLSVPEGDYTNGYMYADNFRIACWR